MSIPNFLSAETAWLTEPPEEIDHCDTGDCDTCPECLAAIAQDEADEYADTMRKERRWES